MKVTAKNVLLDQPGFTGRVVAYPKSRVAHLLGCAESYLADLSEDAIPLGSPSNIRTVIERHIAGRIIRRGTPVS